MPIIIQMQRYIGEVGKVKELILKGFQQFVEILDTIGTYLDIYSS